MSFFRNLIVAMLLCGSTVFVTNVVAADQAAEWQWRHDDKRTVALLRGETVVWQFCFASDQKKPYFHPVALTDGIVLTWNSPPDHPWHHALWFAWKYLNGVNYWERDRRTGQPEGRTEWHDVKVVTRPDHSASLSMDLNYRTHDEPPVLTEKRTIEVSAPDNDSVYRFDWTSAFTAGSEDVVFDRTPLPDEPGGKAFGGYAGLSVRFAKALEERQAATTAGPAEFSQQSRHRSKAPAMDYNGTINGQPVGIAICDHPDNLNQPTPWYAIRSKSMSYFSPAVICYGPYTLPAGKSFTLRYRVIVHPGRWDADRLRAEYKQFAESAR